MKTKFLKTICVVLAGVTALCGFSSCDKDDDGVGGNGGKPTWVLVMCSEHDHIEIDGGTVSGDWDQEFTSYPDGRIKSETDDGWSYKYEGNNITTNEGDVFKLGKNGCVTSFNAAGKDGFAQYDSKGYITKFNEDDKLITDLKWSGGLLTGADMTESYSGSTYTRYYSFEYYNTEMINADCIAVLNAQRICWNVFDGYWSLGIGGFWGKMPNKPIKKLTRREYNSSYMDYETYTYENIDENGCPGVLKIGTPYGYSLTYTLIWKKL